MSKKRIIPNTFIIGASKCGTTALHAFFEKHPNIYTTTKKELHYHSSSCLTKMVGGPGDKYLMKNICSSMDDYLSHYKDVNDEKSITDISPSYLFFPHESSSSILKTCGKNVKIIILVKDPVEKIISQYSHLLSAGREKYSFEEALNLEDERKTKKYSDMWLLKESGFMSEKIEVFQSKFDCLILNSKDMQINQENTLKMIFRFLNVPLNNFNYELKIKSNSSGIPRNRLYSKIIIRPNLLSYTLRKVVPAKIGRQIRAYLNDINKGSRFEVDPNSKQFLRNYYSEEIKSLNNLIMSETKIQ